MKTINIIFILNKSTNEKIIFKHRLEIKFESYKHIKATFKTHMILVFGNMQKYEISSFLFTSLVLGFCCGGSSCSCRWYGDSCCLELGTFCLALGTFEIKQIENT